jgi:glycosyltransferase involved in cell wall biosynthesis
MESSVKLVHIITDLSAGGAQSMLLNLLKYADRERYSISVISLTTKGSLGSQIESLGVQVYCLDMVRGRFHIGKFFKLILILRGLRPNVVHTWLNHSDLLGGIASKIVGVRKVIWSIHMSNLSTSVNKKSTLFIIKICAILSKWIPDAIISCSNVASKNHVLFGYDNNKIITIPNGFDLDKYHPSMRKKSSLRMDLGLPKDSLIVGMISRYDAQKNYEGFIKASGLIHKERRDIFFVLVGAGVAHHPGLLEAIKKEGVSSVTYLLGERTDIPNIMASIDILASPSHGEAFSMVIGEAMACGTPCVVTDVGDSALIIQDSGSVVKPGDMIGFAGEILKIFQLSKHERKTLSVKSRDRISSNFEIKLIVKKYQTVYRKLL